MGFFDKIFKQNKTVEQSALEVPEELSSLKSEQEILERFGGIVFDRQLEFGDIIGDHNWNINIEKAEISFGDDLISNSGIRNYFTFFTNLALGMGKHKIRTY